MDHFFIISYLLFWACMVYEAQAVGTRIWIDERCDDYPVPDALTDVKNIAGRAWQITDAEVWDPNQSLLLGTLWQRTLGTVKAEIQDRLLRVYQLTDEDDRDRALIRIYCDDDGISPNGRWTLKQDRDGDLYPNSQRTLPTEQEFVDKNNDLQHTGPMCSTDDNLFAISYKTPWTENGEESEDFEGRMTITLCHKLLEIPTAIRFPMVMDIFPRVSDQAMEMDDLKFIWSKVLFQEIMKSPAIGLPEAPSVPQPDSFREIAASRNDQLSNPAAYAWYALGAELANFGRALKAVDAKDGRLYLNNNLYPGPWPDLPP